MHQQILYTLKLTFVLASLSALVGCTAMVEKRILTTGPVVTGLGDLDEYYAENRLQYCSPNENHVNTGNDEIKGECVTYYDMADFTVEHEGELVNLAGQNFTFNNLSRVNPESPENIKPSLSERIEFEFPELPENAPVAVISPGFGLKGSQTIALWAGWFRHMGIHPLVLSGPTEYKPMQFGLNKAELIAELIAEEYSDRQIILVGFSMGAVGTSEIEQQLLRLDILPTALMLVAPMTNFRDQALAVFENSRARDWRVRWLVSEARYAKALQRVIDASEVDEGKLQLHPRLAKVSTPMVIGASKVDDVVEYKDLRAPLLVEEDIRELTLYPDHPDFLVTVENLANSEAQLITVPRLNHAGMFMLLKPIRTPLQEWLSTRVELTFAPETEYPEHSEE